MTLEDQITALLAEAEPLRLLPDEEAEARGLPALVERINLLRGMQLTQGAAAVQQALDEHIAVIAAMDEAQPLPKRRGRPPKARQEGADA
jgi:hypothetical protein